MGEVNKEGKRRRWGVVSFLWLESRDFTAAAAWFFFWLRGEAGKGDDEASAAETIDAGSRGFFPDGGAHAVT